MSGQRPNQLDRTAGGQKYAGNRDLLRVLRATDQYAIEVLEKITRT